MKNVWYASAIIAAFIVLIIASCQKAAVELPELPTVEEYHSWQEPTDIHLNYPIPGHGDTYREIYINPIGETVEEKMINGRQCYIYPPGTVIVKEIYQGLDTPAAEEKPLKLNIMIKAPDHPQALNGWLWLESNFPPTQPHIFTHRLCVDCHANANETHPYGDMNPQDELRDFVFFPPDKHQTPPTHDAPATYE